MAENDNENTVMKTLIAENQRLKRENRACLEQGRLFESFLEMVGAVSEEKLLRHTMRRTLEITARLSGAETGSLFLLDESGRVTDSLLTRGEVSADERSTLLGTVLDQGLAGWVRQHKDVGLVADTKADDRWIQLPDQPYTVRSALAVPIIKNGALFGILTLMHVAPDFFSPEAVETVRMTADHMALAIEGASLYVRMERLNRQRREAMARDLDLARQVQESFLPARMPMIDGYSFSAVNQPALAVGGDFYSFYTLPGKKLGIALGDVSGKGIAASLFMARLSSELQHYAPVFMEPGRLMSKINRVLCKRSQQGMFVTLIYLVVDLNSGIVLFANAGHIPPLLLDGGGVTPMTDSGFKGPPLGIVPEAVYGQESFVLEENANALLLTDGVLEARNPEGGIYGLGRFCEDLEQLDSDSPGVRSEPDRLIEGVLGAVDRFSQGQGPGDDLTLAAIHRMGRKK
ncbi:MAG: SpoIIE family protein phosphatase [Desulfobacterales bacterium]|nr:SpoIIE family protein phosphatase [Desulfobacterales bacterium]